MLGIIANPLLCICVIWAGAVGHPGLDFPSMHPSRVQEASSLERRVRRGDGRDVSTAATAPRASPPTPSSPSPSLGLQLASSRRGMSGRGTAGGTLEPTAPSVPSAPVRTVPGAGVAGGGGGGGAGRAVGPAPVGRPRAMVSPEWELLFSLDHHHEYYSNVETGVSVWTLPPGITPPPRSLVDAVRRRAIAGPAPATAAAAAAAVATAGRL